MNKISTIEGSLNLPCLKELIIADNLIKDIHPFMFSKLPHLELLDMSINQINFIQNLH